MTTQITPQLDGYAPPSAGAMRATIVGWLKMLVPLTGLAGVVLFFSVLRWQRFATWSNFELILTQTAVVGTAALGMTMIIIAGGIDLSVGSFIALGTVVIAMVLNRHVPPGLAALASIAVGAVVGLLIGLLVTYGALLPFIVTLGLLGALRGVAQLLGPNGRVPVIVPDTWLNNLLIRSGDNYLVPAGVWIMVGLALLVAGVLRYTKFGRHVFAVGSNEQAARLCGVPVERTTILVYVFAGALNGVAATLLFASLGMGDSTGAQGYELNVIAAVVIGGASLSGGEGTVLGSLVGAVLMTTLANGCTKMDWPNPVQLVVTGVIIILAAAIDRVRHRWVK